MFGFLKASLHKIYSAVTSKLSGFFSRSTIDESTLTELEILLIEADTGVKTTRTIIEQLRAARMRGDVQAGSDLRAVLKTILCDILALPEPNAHADSRVHILVGVNGTGKTTFSGKLAKQYALQGKRVLLVAADTFRAAAPEQLAIWAQKTGADIELGAPGQDPASVVYAGCERFKKEAYDILIVDTAGRLHTKINLMNELAKIKRVITKQLPNESMSTLLTVDSMLGQNSFEQAKLFKECTDVNGIVLTKMDGTGKGGIVFAIANELRIPIAYIAFGEQPEQLKLFAATDYVEELLG